MKNPVIKFMTLSCLVFASAAGATAAEHQRGPHEGSKEFERLKALVGVWEGAMVMGEQAQKVKVEYRLTAGGSALVETHFPGTPMEMVSLYHDRGGKLAMTHYCMLRNQPRLKLQSSDETSIALEFDAASDLDPAKEAHMHALTVRFLADDRIEEQWVMFSEGKSAGSSTLTLARVK